jgi:hypothetical protein
MEGKGNTRPRPDPFILFFNVRLRLSYIPIFDNLGKNQVNLMSIFLSWISKEEKENKELRIAVTL